MISRILSILGFGLGVFDAQLSTCHVLNTLRSQNRIRRRKFSYYCCLISNKNTQDAYELCVFFISEAFCLKIITQKQPHLRYTATSKFDILFLIRLHYAQTYHQTLDFDSRCDCLHGIPENASFSNFGQWRQAILSFGAWYSLRTHF